jgi:hypothetical protein
LIETFLKRSFKLIVQGRRSEHNLLEFDNSKQFVDMELVLLLLVVGVGVNRLFVAFLELKQFEVVYVLLFGIRLLDSDILSEVGDWEIVFRVFLCELYY